MSIQAADDLVSVDLRDSYERTKMAANILCQNANPEQYSRLPETMPRSSESALVLPGDDKMSSVRRTFCLFVTFDLGLTFILWVIYTQLIGQTGWTAFEKQVEQYNFKLSLFDTVMLAAVRFTFLLLGYALLRLKHWWMIAITTTLSSVFLLTKVFLFDFTGEQGSKNPLSYCLLIVSFVLAWIETWFLDFKVLPQEKKDRERLISTFPNYGSISSDRRRLLPPEDARSTATFDQYYSPVGTPEGSDTEDADHPSTVGVDQSQNQHQEEYANIAQECWEAMWDYLSCPDSEWKHETGKSIIEGIIHSKHDTEYGKIYRLQGEVDMDAKGLWEEMVHNINKAPSWNPTLIECNTVAVLDENTDISHNVANDAVGGLIASRDFVNLRHWGIREGIYISAGQGVTHPDCPPSKKRVRGFNGPGGWAFRPVPGEPNRCVFIWIMNTNLKGWIPQRVIDQASSAVMLDYLKHLRRHVAHLQHRG